MTHDEIIAKGRKYLREEADIGQPPRSATDQDAHGEASEALDSTRDQAKIAASDLLVFSTGVDAEVRESIANCCLLAQLVADNLFPKPEQSIEWFAAYQRTLTNAGWVLHTKDWQKYGADGRELDVHEKIIDIMKVALGATATAIAIVTATIDALKAMKPDSSWIRLFERNSRKAEMRRFQVGLVEPGDGDQVKVMSVGCMVKAQTNLTQLLVFKWRSASVELQALSFTITIDRHVMRALQGDVRNLVIDYSKDYLSKVFGVSPVSAEALSPGS